INYSKDEVSVDGIIIKEPYVNGTTTNAANWKVPYVIPKGYCFVMGDNRNVSKDSRSDQVGLIPLSDIIGKAQFVIFPINHFGPINNNTGESNYSGNTASTY
ncbi:MAG: signal peptidase I, partial [Bacillota bacterium]|nr:signal peptidase I [Bacillota bacterium]